MHNSILTQTKSVLGVKATIITRRKLKPFLTGFRGKIGDAIFAISPRNILELYKLINLYSDLKVGYILQGANTSLKGQSTPNLDSNKPIVIIRTNHLTQHKILDYPGSSEYKILLVEPGLSLKSAENFLTPLGYDLPHKIGSHELGNTFGASCANGCGGMRVDNRDGRASTTIKGNMGVVSLSTNGIMYNGFIRKNFAKGVELLEFINANQITINDIELPSLGEIEQFLASLYTEKSYPIYNHRGENIFAGDGAEGTQAILYQMYLIRKKPKQVNTHTLIFKNLELKEQFYQEVILQKNVGDTHVLPIVCESMNANLFNTIIKNGIGFVAAFIMAQNNYVNKYLVRIMRLRNNILRQIPLYFKLENFIGKILAKRFIPEKLQQENIAEVVLIQIANRENQNYIAEFQQKLEKFVSLHKESIEYLIIEPNSFNERLLLQVRNVAAITTVELAISLNGELLAFDDAVMPGIMTTQYCDLFMQKLQDRFPSQVLPPFLYGHDLKQINHNDWIIPRKLSANELVEVHKIQQECIRVVGGIPHAEHGIGDCAATDLDENELIKLVAHRLLNDTDGLANPGGAYEKAYQKALLDKNIVTKAECLVKKSLEHESSRNTLFL